MLFLDLRSAKFAQVPFWIKNCIDKMFNFCVSLKLAQYIDANIFNFTVIV